MAIGGRAFGWWRERSNKRSCTVCGKKYFFYKKDKGTYKEKFCSEKCERKTGLGKKISNS